MKKIILMGYMGSGKSSVAQILSQIAGLPLYDLDQLIESESGQSITELFERKGEIHFRKLEHLAFKSALDNQESFVMSLGGGTPCYANNHLLLKREDVQSFYLKTSIAALVQRLTPQKEHRPLLASVQDRDLESFIGQSLFERSYYYHQATHVIETDGKSPSALAAQIALLLD